MDPSITDSATQQSPSRREPPHGHESFVTGAPSSRAALRVSAHHHPVSMRRLIPATLEGFLPPPPPLNLQWLTWRPEPIRKEHASALGESLTRASSGDVARAALGCARLFG
ncbi:hypothetical protein JDV02_007835 [Purpureocillium takamizusanense]|uniref:Uncharacterized protein n=1 Tax=Purpureocillium takamizusanense TaxID=2060973 RepID=A0A9Q8VDQ0_9HYPO|nr:uncharacterized protein JDV02_007835 [Purpureocillium takamizusanense]UNI21888.1 hypothetical protein JDV02_007835 [Purpureocillium takamizusanense]